MLKRIAFIALFTGMGHLLSIIALKYVSQHSTSQQLKAVAEIDSLVFFIMNIIAMGLQSAAIRDLALSTDWKKDYVQTQSARITMGILLTLLAALAFINPYYILFLAAPIFAWSGDYALYARGYAITGSIIAFIRLLIPFSCLIFATQYQSEWLALIYGATLIIIYILTNFSISWLLKTPYFFFPSIKSLRLYLDSFYLGIVVLSLYFIGLGLILVIPYFYENTVVAVAFIGLKFYIIFKGVLRIIHQAFITEMKNYEACFKVDQMAALIGLSFLSFIACFPDTFIRLFFGEKFLPHKTYFILVAVAAFVYSLFSSLIIKAMLEKKDKLQAMTSFLSAMFTLVICIFFSFVNDTAIAVGVSLIIGELFFAAGMLILMNRWNLFQERILFMAKNFMFAIVPLGIKFFWGDKIMPFIAALVFFAVIMAIGYYRKFNLSQIN